MFSIHHANPADQPAINQLLNQAALLYEDIQTDHLPDFLVLVNGQDVLGCVGIERMDKAGLLRSLAIDERLRGDGHGQRLLETIEAHARDTGISALYLLTTTAAPFFEKHGYQHIERAAMPSSIQGTQQFTSLCPASATCMFKHI